jgi:peptide/nickel transport system substrate-binding protein
MHALSIPAFRLRGIALAACLTLVVAACGSAATPTPAPTAAPTAGESATPTAAPTTAQSPGPTAAPTPSQATLRVGWSSEPDTMNPLTTYSTEAQEVLQLVYDRLLGYGPDLKPEPQLASAYAYSADGLSITFTLRSDVSWSDGQPFTADDVKFTFEFIQTVATESEYSQWLTHLTGVEVSDPTTVVLTFDKPQAFNPALTIPILPRHIWGSMDAAAVQAFANDTPVGTGPFRFVEWRRGESLSLVRNDGFWGVPPIPAGVTFVLFANEDVMAQALKRGDVDVLTEVPPTIWDGLKGADKVTTLSLPSFSFHHIGFNVSTAAGSKGNPLLKDRTIRQALNYAVDRKQLVELALAGHGVSGSTLIPVGLADWYYEPGPDEQMNANPEKAKALLDAAGYTDRSGDGVREDANGKPLEFRLIAIESTGVDVRAAQLFRDAAAAVGIKLDLTTLDENTLGNTVYNTDAPDWDIFVWGWDSSVPDPDYMLGVPLCSQIGGNNDVFYCSQEYEALYDQQATTVDPVARKALTDRMQKMFYEDAAYIVMWYQDKLQAYRTDTWTGWLEMPGGILYNFPRVNYLQVVPAK